MTKKSLTIIIPPNLATFTDAKTGVKTVALPFQFSSGTAGVMSITHIDKMGWDPADDLDTIIINFKE